jgi:hypothetical protein
VRALVVSSIVLLLGGGPATRVGLSPADPSIDASLPQVALDARGDAFAVWQERRPNGVFTRAAIRPRGGSWSAARTLARGGYVDLAVDARGDAVVAGLTLADPQGVFAVYRPAGGGWGRAMRLSGPAGTDVELSAAIDANGRAFASWAQGGDVEVSSRSEGRWSTHRVGAGAEPTIAVDPAGNGLLVWHIPARDDGRFLASWKTPRGAWQRPSSIPLPPGPGIRPEQAQVALDGKGDASVFWTNWDADVYTSNASRNGPFNQPLSLQIGNDAYQARAAVAPDGAAALAAVANRGNGPVELRLRSSATGDWRPPITLGASAVQSALALDRAGRLVVSWIEPQGDQLLLEVATGTTAGRVSRPETLATVGSDCFMHRCLHGGDPAVAIGSGGRALVAWAAKTDPIKGAGVVEAASLEPGS